MFLISYYCFYLIDVKCASGVKNIHFSFYPYTLSIQCDHTSMYMGKNKMNIIYIVILFYFIILGWTGKTFSNYLVSKIMKTLVIQFIYNVLQAYFKINLVVDQSKKKAFWRPAVGRITNSNWILFFKILCPRSKSLT